MPSSILFETCDKAIQIVDLPATIEEAQLSLAELAVHSASRCRRRLITSPPLEHPFEVPDFDDGSLHADVAAQIADLRTAAAVDAGLELMRKEFLGPWHLPRVTDKSAHASPSLSRDQVSQFAQSSASPYIPRGSVYIESSIAAGRDRLIKSEVIFDLIILDPPWPNRSARRKRGTGQYATATNVGDIRKLLLEIPIAEKLGAQGIVAIWVTNKPAVREVLNSFKTGLFRAWGLELVDEWTWLKVTSKGEPIFDITLNGRRPWEKLLIARRCGVAEPWRTQERLIVSVPDKHSRKPNLRGLLEGLIPADAQVLEVFARNLTAGWWSWGDEVLKFQSEEHWVEQG